MSIISKALKVDYLAKVERSVRAKMIQDGPIDNGNGEWFLSGIVVDTANVTVESGFYLVPDMESANDTKGRGTPGFITDDGPGCVVDGFTSWGRALEGGWNKLIYCPKGTVKNSRALLIGAMIEENNTYDPGPRPNIDPFPESLLVPPAMGTIPPVEPPIDPPPVDSPIASMEKLCDVMLELIKELDNIVRVMQQILVNIK
jgi:hypothetical protein